MTTLPQNQCVGLSIAGPFPQTIFLGCSVMSFSTSLGWNGSSSELAVQLVYDSCAGNSKEYYDENLVKQTTTMADPGFIGLTYDIMGCPVFFRVGEFEYTGLVQSWTEENSTSGKPTYSVQITDPRLLLENSKLIIGEYAGNIGGIANVFNVYGMMESLGVSCPQLSLVTPGAGYVAGDLGIDGATFGSPAGGFGGADLNRNGMPWYNIVNGINLLANQIPKAINQYSAYGRITFKGIDFGGFGLCKWDNFYLQGSITSGYTRKYLSEYFLDLSELPTPPTYWRLSGSNISIIDAINQLCTDAGYDYYIELIPLRHAYYLSQSGIAKFIKVRTVKRLSQPGLGTIASFIGDGSGTLSAKRGLELRNETTSSICIGGSKQTYYQIQNVTAIGNNHEGLPGGTDADDDYILPYFGLYPYNKNVIIPQKEKINRLNNAGAVHNDASVYEWWFWAETTDFYSRLPILSEIAAPFDNILNNAGHGLSPSSPSRYAIKLTEYELMCAIAGFDVWLSCVGDMFTDTGNFLHNADIHGGVFGMAQALKNLARNKILAGDARHLHGGIGRRLPADVGDMRAWEEVHILYDWVATFAQMLGRKFMVKVPYTVARLDSDSGQVITSEEPAIEGWTEHTNILGLSSSSIDTELMRAENNNYVAMIVIDDSSTPTVNNIEPFIPKDISAFQADEILINTTTDLIYIKAQDVDAEYVYTTYATRVGPRAVISVSNPIMVQIDEFGVGMRAALEHLNRIAANGGLADAVREKALDKFNEVRKKGGAGVSFSAPLPYNYDTNPIGVGFGIKSNTMVYGPWFSIGPLGGVKIESDSSLVPWEYNGYALMNLAGQSKAEEGLTNMQIGEMGDLTVPGYPTVPLGAELGAIAGGVFGAGTQLLENRLQSLGTYNTSDNSFTAQYGYFSYTGAWTGLYGPNITSIRVSVGDNGVQTSYEMKTYSPKFGRFTKANIDRLKLLGQNQLKAQKLFFARIGKRIISDASNNLKNNRVNLKDIGLIGGAKTPNSVIIGTSTQDVDDNGAISDAYTLPMIEIYNERSGWATKGIMSLDGFFRPISLRGDGNLPRLATPINSGFPTTTQSQPPIYKDGTYLYHDYTLPIFGEQIQPFQNPEAMGGQAIIRAPGSQTGNAHDITILGFGTAPPTGTGVMDSICVVPIDAGPSGNYATDYRGLAIKGPIFMHSWGYDTEGRPIPNMVDTLTDASGGIFNPNTKEQFLPNFLRHPETWPVAPIDLRFDRDRGVWTTPPSYTMLVGRMISGICGTGYGCAIITDGPSIPDSGGNLIIPSENVATAPRVHVYNRLPFKIYPSGTQVILNYNTKAIGPGWTGEYHIVESDASEPAVVAFRLKTEMPYCSGILGAIKMLWAGDQWVDAGDIRVGNGIDNLRLFGPSPINATGIASLVQTSGKIGCGTGWYTILQVEEYPTFINFSTTTQFNNSTSTYNNANTCDGTIDYSWHGDSSVIGNTVAIRFPGNWPQYGDNGRYVTGLGVLDRDTMCGNKVATYGLLYRAACVHPINSTGTGLWFDNYTECPDSFGTDATLPASIQSLYAGMGLKGVHGTDSNSGLIHLDMTVSGHNSWEQDECAESPTWNYPSNLNTYKGLYFSPPFMIGSGYGDEDCSGLVSVSLVKRSAQVQNPDEWPEGGKVTIVSWENDYYIHSTNGILSGYTRDLFFNCFGLFSGWTDRVKWEVDLGYVE